MGSLLPEQMKKWKIAMKNKKKIKQCQYGIANYPGDIYTNVESGTLTLSALRKLWNSLDQSKDVPTRYYDEDGLHKIKND